MVSSSPFILWLFSLLIYLRTPCLYWFLLYFTASAEKYAAFLLWWRSPNLTLTAHVAILTTKSHSCRFSGDLLSLIKLKITCMRWKWVLTFWSKTRFCDQWNVAAQFTWYIQQTDNLTVMSQVNLSSMRISVAATLKWYNTEHSAVAQCLYRVVISGGSRIF